ncbi:MAG TPA: hypothetical protein VKD22_11530 [Ramlibacter sp.]|nr:hypothetical protein [Ramlibacter sp.]
MKREGSEHEDAPDTKKPHAEVVEIEDVDDEDSDVSYSSESEGDDESDESEDEYSSSSSADRSSLRDSNSLAGSDAEEVEEPDGRAAEPEEEDPAVDLDDSDEVAEEEEGHDESAELTLRDLSACVRKESASAVTPRNPENGPDNNRDAVTRQVIPLEVNKKTAAAVVAAFSAADRLPQPPVVFYLGSTAARKFIAMSKDRDRERRAFVRGALREAFGLDKAGADTLEADNVVWTLLGSDDPPRAGLMYLWMAGEDYAEAVLLDPFEYSGTTKAAMALMDMMRKANVIPQNASMRPVPGIPHSSNATVGMMLVSAFATALGTGHQVGVVSMAESVRRAIAYGSYALKTLQKK